MRKWTKWHKYSFTTSNAQSRAIDIRHTVEILWMITLYTYSLTFLNYLKKTKDAWSLELMNCRWLLYLFIYTPMQFLRMFSIAHSFLCINGRKLCIVDENKHLSVRFCSITTMKAQKFYLLLDHNLKLICVFLHFNIK